MESDDDVLTPYQPEGSEHEMAFAADQPVPGVRMTPKLPPMFDGLGSFFEFDRRLSRCHDPWQIVTGPV